MSLKQYAAVKKISIPNTADPKQIERVITEIQAMLDMQGANNIVRIEEFDELDWPRGGGKDILIRMELLTSLDSIVKESTLPVDEVVKLGTHICKALELCESRKIVHRDIKPGNILVSGYGEYKLGDFGIARSMGERRTFTGIGTDDFIAPEVYGMLGKREYDSRADIYSLGITLYYLLNQNKLPFEDTDSEGYIYRRRMGEVLPLPRNTPEWLAKVVLKACAYKPEDRYASAAEMRAALEQANNDAKVIAHPQATPVSLLYPDPEVCFKIGENYYKGRGVSKNYTWAREWYHKAAVQGYAPAQHALADLYYYGRGVSKDYAEAVKYYRAAAEKDYAMAQYRLGVFYVGGGTIPRDCTEAVKWFSKAAEQGYDNAQYYLGVMYTIGSGVPHDYTEAVRWYRKAADQGHEGAKHNLGDMYFFGQGVDQDFEKAMEWYREAAEQGHIEAQYDLGNMYKDGQGTPQDYTEAIRWYGKAAAQGHQGAKKALDGF